MNLNFKSRKKLRKKMLDYLECVPDEEKIKLPYEVLDVLIFEKYKYPNSRMLRVPVWTGSFLRKIDFSDVCFDDVLLNYSADLLNLLGNSERFSLDDNTKEYRDNYYEIDFSGSNIEFNSIVRLDNLPFICNCNLVDVDLSGVNPLQLDDYSKKGGVKDLIEASDLSNTGLRLEISKGRKIGKSSHMAYLFDTDCLKGCYINDRLIKPYAEKEENKARLLEKYNNLEQSYYDIIDDACSKYVRKREKD